MSAQLIVAIIGLILIGLEAFKVPNPPQVSWGWFGLLLCGIAFFFL